jgi:hypothetical protein
LKGNKSVENRDVEFMVDRVHHTAHPLVEGDLSVLIRIESKIKVSLADAVYRAGRPATQRLIRVDHRCPLSTAWRTASSIWDNTPPTTPNTP